MSVQARSRDEIVASLKRLGSSRERTPEASEVLEIIVQAADAVLVTDVATGILLEANTRAEELLGRARENLVGIHFSDLHPASSSPEGERHRKLFEAASKAARSFSEGLSVLRPDGTMVPVNIGSNTIRFPDNRKLTLGFFQKIPEGPEEPERVNKLLRAVEQSNDIIFMTDLDGQINYVNPAFEQTYGYSKEEVYGKTARVLKSGKMEEETYQELWNRLLAGRPFSGEFINQTKDGRLVTVQTSLSVVRNEKQDLIGFICVQRDVTETKRLEEQLVQAQKMEVVGKLAGGVAHDFNNLLTGIGGFTELLLSEVESNSRAEEDLKQILHLVDRAAALTRQLLVFSRRDPISHQILNLNDIVGSLHKILERMLGEDVRFEMELEPELWNIESDAVQMEQIIMNLVVNSRDAMPEGGRLLLRTSNMRDTDVGSPDNEETASYVVLSIADTGVGMTPDVKSHIFEPFFTTKKQGQGTGLGLSTVYGIVSRQKGRIVVFSEVGIGTTFKIYLPAVLNSKKTARDELSAEVPSGRETILIVEDEPAVRELATRTLEELGYRVFSGSGAKAGEEIARKEHIDLLLADIVMPGKSGRQLYERLIVDFPDLKVLFMSGYTDPEILKGFHMPAGSSFLEKPFSPSQLGRRVRQVLEEDQTGKAPTSATVLLVEDEDELRQTLARALLSKGYRVLSFGDCAAALKLGRASGVDLVVTDLMLSDALGLSVAKFHEQLNPAMKVLVISGTLEEKEADGYPFLEKPFRISEFLEKVASLLPTNQHE